MTTRMSFEIVRFIYLIFVNIYADLLFRVRLESVCVVIQLLSVKTNYTILNNASSIWYRYFIRLFVMSVDMVAIAAQMDGFAVFTAYFCSRSLPTGRNNKGSHLVTVSCRDVHQV